MVWAVTGCPSFFIFKFMDNTFTLSDVPLVQIERIPTGISYLDLAYGKTVIADRSGRPVNFVAGLPVGAVSLWSGSPGVGKSRVGVAIATSMNARGHRVLFIQNEVSASQFRQWTADKVINPDDFILHTSRDLYEQIKVIRKYRPHLTILDSLNMLDGYQSPAIIRKIAEEYKKAMQKAQGHAILIGHLNKAGSVKGNNDIQYMIDIECNLVRYSEWLSKEQKKAYDSKGLDTASMFLLVFEKNRYGGTTAGGCQNYVCFRHTATGIDVVTSNFANPLQQLPEEDEDSPEDAPKLSKRKRGWSLLGRR